MFQVLSVSARHLALVRPEQVAYYHNLAIRLQTQALSLFHGQAADLAPEASEAGRRCIPVLVFSTLLGVHALCDTLSFRDDDFSMTLARFMGYMRLHRGVYQTVAGQVHQLHQSDEKMLLSAGLMWHRPAGVGHECDDIRHRLEPAAASMEPPVLEAFKKAIDHLQWIFDAGLPDPRERTFMALAWPVMVDSPLGRAARERRAGGAGGFCVLLPAAALPARCLDHRRLRGRIPARVASEIPRSELVLLAGASLPLAARIRHLAQSDRRRQSSVSVVTGS